MQLLASVSSPASDASVGLNNRPNKCGAVVAEWGRVA
jgi:hypothetical protein